MSTTIKNYLPDWQPTEDIAIIIDDKTAQDRSQDQLNAMMDEMREVCGRYGFDFNIWGHPKNIKSFINRVY
jgi:hypothetical protein